MKECRILHIRDENRRTLTDGNRHYAADFPWAEKMLEEYLNAGYRITQMIPAPAPTDGTAFCTGGFTVLLVRESREYDVFVEQEDWERLNTPADYEFPGGEGEAVEDIHDIVDEMVGQLRIGSDDPQEEKAMPPVSKAALLEELEQFRQKLLGDSLERFRDEEGNLPFY